MIRALVCALLCTVGTIVPAKSDDDGPRGRPNLKDVKIAKYLLSVEPPNTGPCAIDLNAWNTAIGFVANQSIKLKLIRDRDHFEQETQLHDEAKKASENAFQHLADERAQITKQEAQERWIKFLYAPFLLFSIQTMDMTIGCAGTVVATVSVGLEPTKIIATNRPAVFPSMEIWSENWLMKGPYAAFPSTLIRTSEKIMKSFVNDWAKSQEE